MFNEKLEKKIAMDIATVTVMGGMVLVALGILVAPTPFRIEVWDIINIASLVLALAGFGMIFGGFFVMTKEMIKERERKGKEE